MAWLPLQKWYCIFIDTSKKDSFTPFSLLLSSWVPKCIQNDVTAQHLGLMSRLEKSRLQVLGPFLNLLKTKITLCNYYYYYYYSFFILVASEGLYYSIHIFMLYNDNQLHHLLPYIFYLFWAPSRVNGRSRARLFLFRSSFFLRASRSSSSKEKMAVAGFDPSNFRSKVDDLDHRTTVSCQCNYYFTWRINCYNFQMHLHICSVVKKADSNYYDSFFCSVSTTHFFIQITRIIENQNQIHFIRIKMSNKFYNEDLNTSPSNNRTFQNKNQGPNTKIIVHD